MKPTQLDLPWAFGADRPAPTPEICPVVQQASPWRHPAATHDIRLGDLRVAFLLQRVQRRSIGLVVTPQGLCVRAPRWVGMAQIEQCLRDRAAWLCRKLTDQQEHGHRSQHGSLSWVDGGKVPWLGRELLLQTEAGADPVVRGHRARLSVASPHAPHDPPILVLQLPRSAGSEQVRDAAHAWMQQQALQHFHERVAFFQARLGVQVKVLKLSSARTRWGSASIDGTVRLHWKLMHFSPAIIDYVVAHELAHLREMNHSPKFWAVVRSVVPEVDVLKKQVRQLSIPE